MKRLIFALPFLLFAVCALAWTHGSVVSWTHGYSFYFTGYGLGPSLQATFLSSPTANVAVVDPTTYTDGPAVHAAGLESEISFAPDGTGYCGSPSVPCQGAVWITTIESLMDSSSYFANQDYIWANEPDAISYSGTPTAAADYTAVANYWHAKGQNKKIGLSLNGLNGTWGKDYLDAGVPIDFLIEESWPNTPVGKGTYPAGDQLAVSKGAYPTVQIGMLMYGVAGFCDLTNATGGGFDFLGWWDLDNYAVYSTVAYSEDNWYNNSVALAGGDYSGCQKPFSRANYPGFVQISPTFSMTVYDQANTTGWSSPYSSTLGLCQYEVGAGHHSEEGGLQAAGITITKSWTSRPCSTTPFTVAVGPSSGACNVSNGTVSGGSTGDFNCLVAYKAQTSDGIWGTTGWGVYQVPGVRNLGSAHSVANSNTLSITTTDTCADSSGGYTSMLAVAAMYAKGSGSISSVSDGTNTLTAQNSGSTPTSGYPAQTFYHAYPAGNAGLATGGTITATFSATDTSEKVLAAFCLWSEKSTSFVADTNPSVKTGTSSGGGPTYPITSNSSGTLATTSDWFLGVSGVAGATTFTESPSWLNLFNYSDATLTLNAGLFVGTGTTLAQTYSPFISTNGAHYASTIASFHN